MSIKRSLRGAGLCAGPVGSRLRVPSAGARRAEPGPGCGSGGRGCPGRGMGGGRVGCGPGPALTAFALCLLPAPQRCEGRRSARRCPPSCSYCWPRPRRRRAPRAGTCPPPEPSGGRSSTSSSKPWATTAARCRPARRGGTGWSPGGTAAAEEPLRQSPAPPPPRRPRGSSPPPGTEVRDSALPRAGSPGGAAPSASRPCRLLQRPSPTAPLPEHPAAGGSGRAESGSGMPSHRPGAATAGALPLLSSSPAEGSGAQPRSQAGAVAVSETEGRRGSLGLGHLGPGGQLRPPLVCSPSEQALQLLYAAAQRWGSPISPQS